MLVRMPTPRTIQLGAIFQRNASRHEGMDAERLASPPAASQPMRALRATSCAAVGILMLAMQAARADREKGLSACEAGDWETAARELVAEASTTTDATVVRCLADMYLGGLGVQRNPAKAFLLWKRLADLGNDEAQDKLGYFYLDGVGTQRDPGKAEQSFLRSAERGNKNAMSELALYYSLGVIGCCRDERRAIYWTERLATLGDMYAEIELMRAYSRGDAVPTDEDRAVAWARRAAEQNSVEAYLFLGYATEQGRGTDKDLVEAYKWFSLATADTKATEAAEAARRRDDIARELTPVQLRRAQRLSLEWPLRQRLP